MHKYTRGWRNNQGNRYVEYLKWLERKEKIKEYALFALGVVIFLGLYAIAGTSDAYVLTH